MDNPKQSLRWTKHQSTLISTFATLLDTQTLVDCTICAEGKSIKAHKVVLSACSAYFATVFQGHDEKFPFVLLKDVKYQDLRALIDYMYRGKVNVKPDQLEGLVNAGKLLQVKGLFEADPKPEASQHDRGVALPLEQATDGTMDTSGANDSGDNSNSFILQAAAAASALGETKNLQLKTNNAENVQPQSPIAQGSSSGGVTPAASGVAAKVKENAIPKALGSNNNNNMNDYTRIEVGRDGQPLYVCQRCDNKYRQQEGLRRHLNECVGKGRMFRCPYCAYDTEQLAHLSIHISVMHKSKCFPGQTDPTN
ncbi:longitudinals lacking protein-like [Drosophila subobscura]|uniref:longitudinals lacking protein-like n=1 Tax=Drosophila subobscura TaxID=7241 RepID=UPI00155ADDCE|nr:longitudinals lacking protein-like [Drosophila subobscura]